MPPKPKFTRDEVAKTAYQIVKEDGLGALTARELGKRLGTSARPIFTAFKNMDDVKHAARELALEEFREYVSDYGEYTPAFKRIGMMIVSYGIHEPELFKLLFMQKHEGSQSIESSLQDLGGIADVCAELVMRDYGVTKEEADILFEQLWIYSYGLGVMSVMGVCGFSEEEIGRRLGTVFAGLVMFVKSGKVKDIYGDVEKNDEGTFHGMHVQNLPFVNAGD